MGVERRNDVGRAECRRHTECHSTHPPIEPLEALDFIERWIAGNVARVPDDS
jgi:hypothetical protein